MIAECDELEGGDGGADKLVAFPSGFVNGRPFYSLRDRIRGEGVEPGDVICFPADAKKRAFWDDYPEDERAFRCYVMPPGYGKTGIEFYPPIELIGQKPLKVSYRGIPRERVGHLCLMWRMDRERFEAQYGEEVLLAIQEFKDDRSVCAEESNRQWDAYRERCAPPTPPVGYYWKRTIGDMGMMKYVLCIDRARR